jgi:hypothetical protein
MYIATKDFLWSFKNGLRSFKKGESLEHISERDINEMLSGNYAEKAKKPEAKPAANTAAQLNENTLEESEKNSDEEKKAAKHAKDAAKMVNGGIDNKALDPKRSNKNQHADNK